MAVLTVPMAVLTVTMAIPIPPCPTTPCPMATPIPHYPAPIPHAPPHHRAVYRHPLSMPQPESVHQASFGLKTKTHMNIPVFIFGMAIKSDTFPYGLQQGFQEMTVFRHFSAVFTVFDCFWRFWAHNRINGRLGLGSGSICRQENSENTVILLN